MGQIEVFRSEQHLSRCAADFRNQMAELEELRELVCLAEAAKELRRPKGLARRAVHSKIVRLPDLDFSLASAGRMPTS